MNLLVFETTGPYASVALINEHKEVLEERSDRKLSHLQSLLPMTEALLVQAGIAKSDLTHIAASRGPGSFTGIRIGVSTARALAQSLALPTIGVPTLRSFAYQQSAFTGLICPLFDARREQVYAGAFRRMEDGSCQTLVEENAYEISDFLERLKSTDPENKQIIKLYGDGISVYEETVQRWNAQAGRAPIEVATENERYQTASAAAFLALDLCERGIAC